MQSRCRPGQWPVSEPAISDRRPGLSFGGIARGDRGKGSRGEAAATAATARTTRTMGRGSGRRRSSRSIAASAPPSDRLPGFAVVAALRRGLRAPTPTPLSRRQRGSRHRSATFLRRPQRESIRRPRRPCLTPYRSVGFAADDGSHSPAAHQRGCMNGRDRVVKLWFQEEMRRRADAGHTTRTARIACIIKLHGAVS